MKDRKEQATKIEPHSQRFVRMSVNEFDQYGDDDYQNDTHIYEKKGDEMMHMVEMTGTHVSFSTF